MAAVEHKTLIELADDYITSSNVDINLDHNEELIVDFFSAYLQLQVSVSKIQECIAKSHIAYFLI